MKNLIVFLLLILPGFIAFGYSVTFPSAPAAGQPGTTAIHMNSAAITAWADDYTNMIFGGSVAPQWKVPANALGKAEGGSSGILCLGSGGEVTLIFSRGLADGDGYDFAVFENGFDDTFLELAWVEVSSDGIHFIRFPHFSDTPGLVDAFGDVNPVQIYGYAGKYRQGYGTPFDFSELTAVSNSIAAGGHSLTSDYVSEFSANIPYLDFSNVKYVRLLDIIGDGDSLDCEGYAIFDPYPTGGSAGFDLDAVGAINLAAVAGEEQEICFYPVPNQKMTFGSCLLKAESDSGLPVSFEIRSGPASVTNDVLFFTGTGTVEVAALQVGDEIYAPAVPVIDSFIVAEEVQHIFIEQLPNLLRESGPVQVNAYSSSGLPVYLQVQTGPATITVEDTLHILDTAGAVGEVTLQAYQPGDGRTAPAENCTMTFLIVEANAEDAPVLMDKWIVLNELPELSIFPGLDLFGRRAVELDYILDLRMSAQATLMYSTNLTVWTAIVPELLLRGTDEENPLFKVRVPAGETDGFYRLQFEEL